MPEQHCNNIQCFGRRARNCALYPMTDILNSVEIVVVHYLGVRPTVAMLNALFRAYPQADVTLVDNSGGKCVAADLVLPHLAPFQKQIRLLINPQTEHGSRGPLSHGAGLDLAVQHARKQYVLSLETDLFILERGAIEYAVSLMTQGYDWAGMAQKPVDGGFASFSPSFAIFKVALVKEHGLSFCVRPLNRLQTDEDNALVKHHLQTAMRVSKGAPLLYPQGKPPDTYRRPASEIETIELDHLSYFDTGEWVHHELTRLGYRGYLFLSPPGVHHTWGSRDEKLFLLNLHERLPGLDINTLLPAALRVARHQGALPTDCLRLVDADGTSAAHWHLPDNRFGVTLTASGGGLLIQTQDPATDKVYISLGAQGFDKAPAPGLGANLTPGALYRMSCLAKLSGALSVQLWVIEYGGGKRLQSHTLKLTSKAASLDFLASDKTESFRVLFRVQGQGSVLVESLALSALDVCAAPAPVVPRQSGYRPKKNACIVICADALRFDYSELAAHYQASDGLKAMHDFAAGAQAPQACYAAAPWTLPSHMSMFTGLHPHQHGYGLDFEVGRCYPPPTHLAFLPDYLRKQGIPSYGFHNGGVMEPKRGLGHGWTNYVGAHPGDVDGPVHNFIQALPDMGDQFFAFIHTYAVHNYYGESSTPFAQDLISPHQRKYLHGLVSQWGNLRWLMAENMRKQQLADVYAVDAVRRLYLGAVLRFDRLLQQIVDALKTTGSFDQCTIILTSDHGEALGEVHSGTQHWSHMTINIHEETVRVPFMVKPAMGRSVALPERMSLVDLPNVVTQCFGLEQAFPVRPPELIFATGATHQFGSEWERTMSPEQRVYRSMLLEGNRKYHLLGNEFYPEKICDLQEDPAETKYVFDAQQPECGRDKIASFVKPIPMVAGSVGDIDIDLLERMRGLGYVD